MMKLSVMITAAFAIIAVTAPIAAGMYVFKIVNLLFMLFSRNNFVYNLARV